MANDKNFKIKNGLKAGRYLQSAGVETAGANGPFGVFSTTLYTGNGSTQTITNGIDLAGDGGLVWLKKRSGIDNHAIYDTERGATKYLSSTTTGAEVTLAQGVQSFDSDGFSIGDQGAHNDSGANFVSWTFKKQSKFFDVVTYTGDGTNGRTVAHDLGTTVGTLIVKCTSETKSWFVWHRGLSNGGNGWIALNDTAAEGSSSSLWNSTIPSDSVFTLGSSTNTNGNGKEYVAYLFAHDTASDSNIKCGGYTHSSGTDTEINLGWQPGWLITKRASALSSWRMYDSIRGFGETSAPLYANLPNAEAAANQIYRATSTGFTVDDLESSGDYIYMAIRALVPTQTLDLSTGHTFSITPTEALDVLFTNPPASGSATGFSVEINNSGGYAITWPSSVKWPGGTTPTATASKELYTFITTDGGTTYYGKLAAGDIA